MRTANLNYLARFPGCAAVAYLVVVIAFLLATSLAIVDVWERQHAGAETAEILSQLERRTPSALHTAVGGTTTGLSSSPVLEGLTVTVAGAMLQQHVTGAVSRFGGTVLSSKVDLQGTRSKQGFITVSVNCEVDQPALQRLLYDLEAGLPFLFVDQLVAQAPEATGSVSTGKVRVLISVSGQWQGTK